MTKTLNRIAYGLCVAGLACAGELGYIISREYLDVPSWREYCEKGRKKNEVATVLAGIVTQQVSGTEISGGDSMSTLVVHKTFFPSAEIISVVGQCGRPWCAYRKIDSAMSLSYKNIIFYHERMSEHMLCGGVRDEVYNPEFKSGVPAITIFNWVFEMSVDKVSETQYKLGPSGIVDAKLLEVVVNDGVITGRFEDDQDHVWSINGRYNKEGVVFIDVHIPDGLGMTLEGKITKD